MAQDMPPPDLKVGVDEVAALVESQWPEWSGQAIAPLASGWDNWMFRLGDAHTVRLPRREVSVDLVVTEARWLPALEGHLPLPVPTPVFLGKPGLEYPWPWTICRWIPGVSAAEVGDINESATARDLAWFLRSLHRAAPEEAPFNPFRSVPLAEKDKATRDRLGLFEDIDGVSSLLPRWERAMQTAAHHGSLAWIHGDFHPHNILFEGGRPCGVIDFGDLAAGDPAVDLSVAWMLLAPERHAEFWSAYGSDHADLIVRSEGWAINQGLIYLAHSADNPIMEMVGRRTLSNLLAV